MLSGRIRPAAAAVIEPLARGLLRIGLTPDAVTMAGTAVVVTTALVAYPQGWLLPGTLIIAVFVLADSMDGTMARLSGTTSPWGAFLDSTLDRIADAAIFGGLTVWFAQRGAFSVSRSRSQHWCWGRSCPTHVPGRRGSGPRRRWASPSAPSG